MKCPICIEIDLVMSDRQGVEIDYCPKCRGVWLDRGELDKIIERSALAPAPQVPPDYFSGQQAYRGHDDHHEKHGSYGHPRKKSWLGELFD